MLHIIQESGTDAAAWLTTVSTTINHFNQFFQFNKWLIIYKLWVIVYDSFYPKKRNTIKLVRYLKSEKMVEQLNITTLTTQEWMIIYDSYYMTHKLWLIKRGTASGDNGSIYSESRIRRKRRHRSLDAKCFECRRNDSSIRHH